MGNDPVRTRLFISTLKGVAFEWFRKLSKGSITCWNDLEALFLSLFFEEEADINMHTLLLTKQKEEELVKDFIERFGEHVRDLFYGAYPTKRQRKYSKKRMTECVEP